jgi:hypothetical protein
MKAKAEKGKQGLRSFLSQIKIQAKHGQNKIKPSGDEEDM